MNWFVASLVALVLVLFAQFKVSRTFKKWLKVEASSGLTGYQVARQILDSHSLNHVEVERVEGSLTDHYDPSSRTVRLSEDVYDTSTISAIAVAAHECGHAIQHQEEYGTLMLRHRIAPVCSIASGAAPFLLFGGFIFRIPSLILFGIVFFAAAVIFHLVTLPVEFDASNRAKIIINNYGIAGHEDQRGIQKVLGAAAFTYVAGALYSLIELIRLIASFAGISSDDD